MRSAEEEQQATLRELPATVLEHLELGENQQGAVFVPAAMKTLES